MITLPKHMQENYKFKPEFENMSYVDFYTEMDKHRSLNFVKRDYRFGGKNNKSPMMLMVYSFDDIGLSEAPKTISSRTEMHRWLSETRSHRAVNHNFALAKACVSSGSVIIGTIHEIIDKMLKSSHDIITDAIENLCDTEDARAARGLSWYYERIMRVERNVITPIDTT